MKAALLQITSSDDPAENTAMLAPMIRQAAAEGAGFVLTPEVSNCVSSSRTHQSHVLTAEADDPVLAMARDEAARAGIWIALGSLGVKTDDPDGRFANRSLMITPTGEIAARYDKVHMFDVTLQTESYRESASYRPGAQAALVETPFGTVGLTICYDLRFPHLHRRLAQAGADILLNPAAFAQETGRAHWEPLLRARAIECGAYVLAAAQTGEHSVSRGGPRSTYGHSLAVSPWGEVLVDMGTAPGMACVDLDLTQVAEARRKVPALMHDRQISGP